MSTSPLPPDETKPKDPCQVCGDIASTNNYGAWSCLPCRTFFRRNGYSIDEAIPCRYGSQCPVTKTTRKSCSACRLTKCLAAGMVPELIRKEDLTGTKRKSSPSRDDEPVVDTTVMIPQQTSLSDTSQSFLSSSDWTMISNVVHAFDTLSPVSEIRRTIESITTTASNLQFDLTQSLQLIRSYSNSLQSFISSTPDFKVLTRAEQWSLLQRNMFGILAVGGMYLMHESGIFDKPEYEMAIVPLYGSEVVQQAKLISTQLECDPTVVKLLLVALAFSSNCFTEHQQGNLSRDSLLHGTFRLFGSQNVYVELIWKYLLDRYNYEEAVQCFSALIKRLLNTLKLSFEIYETNPVFQTLFNSIIREIETSLMVDERTVTPLWGKT